MAIGGVKWVIYRYYIKSIGNWMVIGTILLYAAFTACSVGSSIWLSVWSTDPEASTSVSLKKYFVEVVEWSNHDCYYISYG